MTRRAIFFLFSVPLCGLLLASGFYGPIPEGAVPLPQGTPKPEDKEECYVRITSSIVRRNDECQSYKNEEACRIKKPTCAWQHMEKTCKGHHFARCMRELRIQCKKITRYDGDFLKVPNPHAKNFICDDSKPGQFLTRVP